MASQPINIDMQHRAERNKAQRIRLPKDWRSYLQQLPDDCGIRDVAITFGYSTAVIHRWRKEHKEFEAAVYAKLSNYSRAAINKNTEHNTRKIGNKPRQMSADEIDELILDLCGLENNALAKAARAAIRQLRGEVRALKSEINRRAHSAHVRAAGRPLSAAGGAGAPDIAEPAAFPDDADLQDDDGGV